MKNTVLAFWGFIFPSTDMKLPLPFKGHLCLWTWRRHTMRAQRVSRLWLSEQEQTTVRPWTNHLASFDFLCSVRAGLEMTTLTGVTTRNLSKLEQTCPQHTMPRLSPVPSPFGRTHTELNTWSSQTSPTLLAEPWEI